MDLSSQGCEQDVKWMSNILKTSICSNQPFFFPGFTSAVAKNVLNLLFLSNTDNKFLSCHLEEVIPVLWNVKGDKSYGEIRSRLRLFKMEHRSS